MVMIPPLYFCGVLVESKKIVNAHSLLILALSVLFLLPLTFSLIFFSTLRHAITEPGQNSAQTLLRYSLEQRLFIKTTVSDLAIFALPFRCVLGLWLLWWMVVMVELGWGLESLRQSTYLVKGMRGIAASLLLFFGLVFGITVWTNWGFAVAPGGLRDWIFVALIVISSALIMMCVLHSVATNTVLSMYCKALHGELAGQIAEEFAREYVSLPFDEEKIPHIVHVAQP
ncbi:uncharacterized protein LOC122061677 [Macadamia integrifolia]|uniref:uncharacterized protein LOC122061677 n=1 Tax=Macadamia integrifolia TaxID=60698 RepID=UPI001C533096|nr:uncharacterized protein LOC122061677 [Macadamia integrifolia]